ncbi:lipoprotein [Spiroplasma tabanidicola]|uniref:lipoprotein n=1 Tax=Spiroplasma tabanidicola TaxID=324079 RepID=UPI0012DEB764|nr:lipoprotein [Spiroplasma tabanidicola]
MKKLLGLLGAMGLVATSGSVVVSCGNSAQADFGKEFKDISIAVGEVKEINITIPTTDSESLKTFEIKSKDETIAKISESKKDDKSPENIFN